MDKHYDVLKAGECVIDAYQNGKFDEVDDVDDVIKDVRATHNEIRARVQPGSPAGTNPSTLNLYMQSMLTLSRLELLRGETVKAHDVIEESTDLPDSLLEGLPKINKFVRTEVRGLYFRVDTEHGGVKQYYTPRLPRKHLQYRLEITTNVPERSVPEVESLAAIVSSVWQVRYGGDEDSVPYALRN